MDGPLVSIGIPAYENPKGLRLALETITLQTYKNLEILISEDYPPTTGAWEVIREFAEKDNRIRTFRQGKNIGIPHNFRFLLNKATGKYFMYAQDDDWRTMGYIEKMVEALEQHPESPVAACVTRYQDQFGELSKTYHLRGASPLWAICEDELSFVYMGLWRTELLKQFEFDPDANCIGGDMIVAAHAMLAFTDDIPVIETELYVKGLQHDKIKNWFQADPAFPLKSYYHLMKTLIVSEHIPPKRKLWIPLIACTNFIMVGKAYAAQIIFMLPRDHPIRQWLRKK